jgi:SAM-dependent methyltransferase
VLDAGCGGGRYSFVAGSAGADVISVDISSAVNKAAQLCASLPNVHVLQANLMKLPLPEQSFDRIFSIGVLHHTPDTRAAFDALVPLLKPGGRISIWLYPKWDGLRETMNSFWRGITTHLPHACIHAFSVATSPVGRIRGRVYESGPKWLSRALWQTDKLMPGISNHPDPRQRVCDTFDWFTPQYQWHHTDDEVSGWFEAAGLVNVVNLSESKTRYHVGQGHGVCFTGQRPPSN